MGEARYDALSFSGRRVIGEVCPEIFEDLRTFGEHEECEDECKDNSGDGATDGRDGVGDSRAEVVEIDEGLRKVADGLNGLFAEVVNM